MIPLLLWQCPICGTDDALRHKIRWWKPDRLWCTSCHVAWEVYRFFDRDYQLRVSAGEASLRGEEAPLAEWYDRMKAGLKLTPLQDPSIDLERGEVLWVKSKPVKLLKEIPLPQQASGLHFYNEKLGKGHLFLTNERLLWKGAGMTQVFWLKKMQAAWTVLDRRLAIQYERSEVFKFRFLRESLLKWLTYIALASRKIEEIYGHKISISYY